MPSPSGVARQEIIVSADPRSSSALAGPYYRALGRRLAARLEAQSDNDLRFRDLTFRPVSWLHPRAVWATTCSDSSLQAQARDDIYLDLAAGSGDRPAARHMFGETGEQWLLAGMRKLTEDVDKVIHETSPQLIPEYNKIAVEHVEAAIMKLKEIWPEAAVEFHLLVRLIAYTSGIGFRSATMPDTFGTIYAGLDYLQSVPSSVEMLLHETGHHSLFLRNSYEPFVRNGSQIASHALRPDPRPINGIVHAAHVLSRIATGMTRWCARPGAPDEAHQRRSDALASLTSTLQVTGQVADRLASVVMPGRASRAGLRRA